MTTLKPRRKPKSPFEAATGAELAITDATNLVRDLGDLLDGMPGSERVVAALLELQRQVDAAVDGQVLR